MKRIGLIGGVSWAASREYYTYLNLAVQSRLGGNNSAKLVINSINFEEILRLRDDQSKAEDMIYDAAQALLSAGVDALAIGSVTGHCYSRRLEALPTNFIHIMDALIENLRLQEIQKLGILATSTLVRNENNILSRLSDVGIDVLFPDSDEQIEIDRIIFNELAVMKFSEKTKAYLAIKCEKLQQQGAEAVLLGTTEFSRVWAQIPTNMKSIDAAKVHSDKLIEFSLGE